MAVKVLVLYDGLSKGILAMKFFDKLLRHKRTSEHFQTAQSENRESKGGDGSHARDSEKKDSTTTVVPPQEVMQTESSASCKERVVLIDDQRSCAPQESDVHRAICREIHISTPDMEKKSCKLSLKKWNDMFGAQVVFKVLNVPSEEYGWSDEQLIKKYLPMFHTCMMNAWGCNVIAEYPNHVCPKCLSKLLDACTTMESVELFGIFKSSHHSVSGKCAYEGSHIVMENGQLFYEEYERQLRNDHFGIVGDETVHKKVKIDHERAYSYANTPVKRYLLDLVKQLMDEHNKTETTTHPQKRTHSGATTGDTFGLYCYRDVYGELSSLAYGRRKEISVHITENAYELVYENFINRNYIITETRTLPYGFFSTQSCEKIALYINHMVPSKSLRLLGNDIDISDELIEYDRSMVSKA